MSIHDDYRILGRVTRLAAGLPETDCRHDFKQNPANRTKTAELIRRRYANGKPCPELTDQQKEEYLKQFDDLADMIRSAVSRPGGLRTPQEVRAGAAAGSGYFVVEWRIRTINRDPVDGACGCGCGCGCGG